jgi:uncharacterized protein (TIGR03382 family)
MYQHPRGLGLTAEDAQQWIDVATGAFRNIYTTLKYPSGALPATQIVGQVSSSPGLWILGGAVLLAVLLRRR